MQKYDTDIDLLEGTMHTPLFVTGVGTVGASLKSGVEKVDSMKLSNNGSMVEIGLKIPKSGKIVVELVHIVNFIGVTVKDRLPDSI